MAMKTVVVGILVVALVLFISVFVLMKSHGMIQFGRRAKTVPWYPVKDGKVPLGLACVVDPEAPMKVSRDCVGVWAFNDIYASIGITSHDFQQWEDKHGMASLGIDSGGKSLAPDYPVLSKVAWMSIDPVTLTHAETAALIGECERAIASAVNEQAKAELEAIRALAEKALSSSAVIQFGHP